MFKTKPRHEPDRMPALEARVAALESQLKGLDAEWTEMYDKFRRLHMRLAKRDQRAEDAPGPTNGQEKGEGTLNPLAQRLLGL
jgi:hypothetical protein